MNLSGHHLFSGPRFPPNQDIDRGIFTQHLDLGADLADSLTDSGKILGFSLQKFQRITALHLLQTSFYNKIDFIHIKRFQNIIVGPSFGRLHCLGYGAVGRHQNDLDILIHIFEGGNLIHTHAMLQKIIQDHDIRVEFLYTLYGLLYGPGRFGVISPVLQPFLQCVTDQKFIIHD